MFETDSTADNVQPDEGQGSEGTSGGSPYADYLSRIPEEYRGEVEPVFQDWDRNVTRRFQEASEYRKQWEPYESLREQDPQYWQEARAFAEAARNDPAALREWLDQNHGRPEAPQPAQPEADPYAPYDPNAELKQLLESQLSPLQEQLQGLTQWQQQQIEQAQLREAQRSADSAIDDLMQKHQDAIPEPLRENFKEIISRFSLPFAEEGGSAAQAVERGWQEYQQMVNQIEKATLQAKVDAPAPAEGGGLPDVSPEKTAWGKETTAAALEAWRAMNRRA